MVHSRTLEMTSDSLAFYKSQMRPKSNMVSVSGLKLGNPLFLAMTESRGAFAALWDMTYSPPFSSFPRCDGTLLHFIASSCVDALLKATILTFSGQESISIYPLYTHNPDFILSTRIFISYTSFSKPWVALAPSMRWTLGTEILLDSFFNGISTMCNSKWTSGNHLRSS